MSIVYSNADVKRYRGNGRIARLEAENARLRKENADLLRWNSALRGNTSKSVLRRLDSMLGEEE